MEKKNTRDTSINTRYPPDVLEAIRTLSKEHERSFNGEVIWALREYIREEVEREEEKRKARSKVTE